MEMNVRLFDKICRVCLVQSGDLKSLFLKTDSSDKSLLEILVFTANIDVKLEDKLPKQVCSTCEAIMCKADAFKRRCHESETILNKVNHNNDCSVFEITKNELLLPVEHEQIILKDKLSNYGSYLSPVSTKNIFEDDFNKKNVQSDFTSFPDQSFDKFPILDKSEQAVKQEELSIIHEDNEFTDDFDDRSQLDTITFDDTDQIDNNIVKIPLTVEKSTKKRNEIDVYFECYCEFKFSTVEQLESHLKEKKCDSLKVTKSNKYKCKFCMRQFKNKITLTSHLLEHNNFVKIPLTVEKSNKKGKKIDVYFECYCELKFSTVEQLESHLKEKKCDSLNVTKSNKYKCTFCMRQFKNKMTFTSHLLKHEETNNIKHVCEICKREFKYKAYLENHVITAHSKKNGLTCDICIKSFLNQEALETHKKSHDIEKKHCCTVCSKAFNMLCTLKEHMRTHTGEKPYLCSQCGKGFSQKTNLGQHMRRHQGFKPFKCDACEKRFVSKGELDAHSRKHSGAHPFVCDECGGGFTTSSALVKHRRKHTGERPYQCDLCPMSFAASGTLTNHRRTHTGERPYQCSLCEKAFVQRNDLISHIRCHTGERPFICTQCGQTFRKASSLKTHLKLHIKDPIVGVNALLTSMLQRSENKTIPTQRYTNIC